LKLVLNHMFTENLRFFGQILHPQWPAQTSEMGQNMALVLWGLRSFSYNRDYIIYASRQKVGLLWRINVQIL
jgi:hypothetical protein